MANAKSNSSAVRPAPRPHDGGTDDDPMGRTEPAPPAPFACNYTPPTFHFLGQPCGSVWVPGTTVRRRRGGAILRVLGRSQSPNQRPGGSQRQNRSTVEELARGVNLWIEMEDTGKSARGPRPPPSSARRRSKPWAPTRSPAGKDGGGRGEGEVGGGADPPLSTTPLYTPLPPSEGLSDIGGGRGIYKGRGGGG